MYIKIYADILFLICLIPELIGLALLSLWQHQKIRLGRLLGVGVCSSAASVLVSILLRQVGFLGLLAVDALIQALSFRILYGKITVREGLELWVLQKLFYLGLGGFLQAVWSRKGMMLPLLLLGFIAGGSLFYGLICYFRRKKQIKDLLFSVELYWHGKGSRCLALLDTGNQLYYRNAPVVLISPELAEQMGFSWQKPTEDYRLIPYASVGCSSGMLHGFVCDRLVIRADGFQPTEGTKLTDDKVASVCMEPAENRINCYEQVIIAVADHPLSGTGDYQMLLHPGLSIKF